MSETYTVSVWSVKDGQESSFIDAFRSFAAAATQMGGAREGMILQDSEEPGRFIVVRHWDDADVVQRWRHEHDAALQNAVNATLKSDSEAHVLTKVADLG